MATKKPISSISYNTESFLKSVLDDLFEQHIIQAYQYIYHKGEGGDKDHIHFRIEPNKSIDPMCIAELFKEPVPNNEKPLWIRPWRMSKEEDWFLYAVHDPDYMKIKYPCDVLEKLPYSYSQIVSSPMYDLDVAWIRAKQSLAHSTSFLVARLRGGADPVSLVSRGENIFTVSSAMKLLKDSKQSRTDDLEKECLLLYKQVDFLRDLLTFYGLNVNLIEKAELTIKVHDDIITSEVIAK